MKAIVMFSGGVGSWAAAKRTASQIGPENVTLLFADTKMEDEDLYRFLAEAAADVGSPLVTIADGRTPWELFRDERFIGNTRVDICSRVLKRDLMRAYVQENFDPADTAVVLGIDWTEIHRYERAIPRWDPWCLLAPLCDESSTKEDLLAELAASGIRPPRLYEMGFPHNNCGGFCVKAGQSQFALLLKSMPDRYAFHERQEQDTIAHIGKKVAILRDRRGGQTKPMTLVDFRVRLEGGESCPSDEWGGCGCALD